MSRKVHCLGAQATALATFNQRTPSKNVTGKRKKTKAVGSPSSPWAFSTILSDDADLDAEQILTGQLRRFQEENGKEKEAMVSSRYGAKCTPATVRRDRLAAEAERSAHAEEEALRQSQRQPLEEEHDENDRFVTFDYWKKRMLIHETSQSSQLRQHNENLRVQASGDRGKLRESELARQRATRRVVRRLTSKMTSTICHVIDSISMARAYQELLVGEKEQLLSEVRQMKKEVRVMEAKKKAAEENESKWFDALKRERLTRKMADLVSRFFWPHVCTFEMFALLFGTTEENPHRAKNA